MTRLIYENNGYDFNSVILKKYDTNIINTYKINVPPTNG